MGIKAHYLQDNAGNKFYPFSHIDATYDKNGQIVGTRLEKIETDLNNRSLLDHTHDAKDVRVILEYSSKTKFPLPGIEKTIYVDKTEDELYRWSEEEFKYRKLNSFESIKIMDGKSIRITLNAKSTDEWNSYADYIPEYGEVCIDTDTMRSKIGDGKLQYTELDVAWLSADDIRGMVHEHANMELLAQMTAVFTKELETAINELIIKNGEENVQVDWFETNESSDAFIKNKPTKVSDFDNDAEYIKQTELERTKELLMSDSEVKANNARLEAKEYAKSLIDEVMGNITDENLNTLEELAEAFRENEKWIDVWEEVIKDHSKTIDNSKQHIADQNIHVTAEMKERWNAAEPNEDTYTKITVNNSNDIVLEPHQHDSILNFETNGAYGIDIKLKEGGGNLPTPHDTVVIQNTRPIYQFRAYPLSNGNTSNSFMLQLAEIYPITGKTIYTNIPIGFSIDPYRNNILTMHQDNGGIRIHTKIIDIPGNAATATDFEKPAYITVAIGDSIIAENPDKATGTLFGSNSHVAIKIPGINIASIYQNDDDTIILTSQL